MNVAFRHPLTEPDEMPQPPAGAARPVRVETLHDIDAAACHWRDIEAAGGIRSPYQSYDWVRLWHRHVSGPAGQSPCIVVGLDADGRALFLWPLLRRRLGPLTVASFFGGKHAPLNVAAWRPDVARGFTAADMRAALAEVGRQCPDLDVLLLSNQPAAWHGTPNPFLLLPHGRAVEDNFLLRLDAPGAEVIAREVSSGARNRLRYHERKLAALPGFRYMRAADTADVERLLAAFFAQKSAKFEALGIEDAFAPDAIRNFVRAACLCGLAEGKPLMELHALEHEGDMLALFSGLHDGGRFTCAFTSHTNGELSRHSPGVALLHRLILDCAERGLRSFDVGPGKARYKSIFCKELEPLFDSVLPLSARGRLLAGSLRIYLGLKSAIKHDATLWRAASAIRSAVNRARGRPSGSDRD
jgi:CelD/BcsL family acetyltransferase involved in cellulose biosynthesis